MSAEESMNVEGSALSAGLDDLPLYLWVVNRKRTREGKPPLKIAPHRIGGVLGTKTFYYAGDPRGRNAEVRYLIEECFVTPEAAVAKVREIVRQELHNEDVRLKKIRAKLKAAMKASNVKQTS